MMIDVAGAGVFAHTGGVPFDRSLPAVMLIHGAGQDHSYFRFQTRALAHRGLAPLAVDLPGHGRTDGPPRTSIEEMSRWIVSVFDVLDIGRWLLVGHSMGSLVALATAAGSDRDRVAGMVLTGTGDAMPVHPALQEAADAGDPLACRLITGWVHTGDARFGGHPQAGTWTRGLTARLLQRECDALGTDLAACAAYDGGAQSHAVTAPAVVIAGAADQMTRPRGARALAVGLRDAEYVELTGVGHDLVLERPEVILDAVARLARRVFG